MRVSDASSPELNGRLRDRLTGALNDVVAHLPVSVTGVVIVGTGREASKTENP